MRITAPKVFLILVGIAVLSVGFIFLKWERHGRDYNRVAEDVRALAMKRPAQVPREQWQYMIGWTVNNVANCLSSPRYADSGKLGQFADELHRRCAKDVDVGTIDWIWDQISVVSPNYGKSYAESYRPTTPERLAESAHISFGIEVN